MEFVSSNIGHKVFRFFLIIELIKEIRFFRNRCQFLFSIIFKNFIGMKFCLDYKFKEKIPFPLMKIFRSYKLMNLHLISKFFSQ